VDSPSHTILIVDDDASIRFLCRVNLELDGWNVREAATLDEARRELADGRVVVTLLDTHIGRQSGLAFLDEMRRDHRAVAVAMLTGSVGAAALDCARADAFIPKPFTLDQLRETVRRLASRAAQTAG
jgi:DNA-binding NtrC family response regulator